MQTPTPSRSKSNNAVQQTPAAAPSASVGLAFSEFGLQDVLEDSPEIRTQLKNAAASSEQAAYMVKAFLKRALALKEALRVCDKERQAMVSSLRQLEPLFSGTENNGAFRVLCDSFEETTKLQAAESQHVTVLLVDPLQPLVDDPGTAKSKHKQVVKLRGAAESLADKVAANDRKDATSTPKADETAAQLLEAKVAYRSGLFDYATSVVGAQRDLRALLIKQLHEFWISRHSSVKSVDKTLQDVQPHVVASMLALEEQNAKNKSSIVLRDAERKKLESGPEFPGLLKVGTNFVQGWLWHRSSGKLGTWSRRFFVMRDGVLRASGEEASAMRLVTARVRSCSEPDRKLCFSVVGPSDELLLQAGTQHEMELWLRLLELETVRLLNETTMNPVATSHGEQRAGGSEPLEKLYNADRECNAFCADCGAANPEWAAVNLGLLFCIQCSGPHRAMGVHVSKVRSFRLDAWSDGELAVMFELGNRAVNALLEARPPPVARPAPGSGAGVREQFALAKYAKRAMVLPGETGEGRLYAAVEAGRLPSVLHLLLLGAGPNETLQDGEFPLMRAVEAGWLAGAELLLQWGADPRQSNRSGRTALHAAAARDDIRASCALLRRGADAGAMDAGGQSAADAAAARGNADCVTLLRLASLSASERDLGPSSDSLSFANTLEDFARQLQLRRDAADATSK